MTHLEKLINDHVSASVVGTLSRTTEKIAEKMATEILRDRKFRARIDALIKQAFEQTLEDLTAPRKNGQ